MVRTLRSLAVETPTKFWVRLISVTQSKNVMSRLSNEEGSAVIEFIILALPLFIPMAIYLTSVNQSANISYDTRNFAREVARVYASSNSAADIAPRIAQLTQSFADNVFIPNKIAPAPEVNVICASDPCLTPGSKISVEVTLKSQDGRQSSRASNVQTVDAWRNSAN